MIARNTVLVTAFASALLTAASVGGAQPGVPIVAHDNPIAGITLQTPEDWDMATNDWGALLIGLHPQPELPAVMVEPQLWFFYGEQEPQAMAEASLQDIRAAGSPDAQLRQLDPDTWQLDCTLGSGNDALRHRWLFRKQSNYAFALAGCVRPDRWQACEAETDAALRSCRLIAGPEVSKFQEPRENAYRMLLPDGYRWEGQIVRTQLIPGAFEWKVQSPDQLIGAFTAPPSAMNITFPYASAAECAQTYILDHLRKQDPGFRLEGVRELPRVAGYELWKLGLMKSGEGARVDKARADYVTVSNGVPVRLRVTIVTVMLGTLPQALGGFGGALGAVAGRGNWTIFASGAWAPVQTFDRDYSIGRGIVASIATDPEWRRRQGEAVSDAAVGWAKARNLAAHCFIIDYLGLRDHHEAPHPIGPHPRHRD